MSLPSSGFDAIPIYFAPLTAREPACSEIPALCSPCGMIYAVLYLCMVQIGDEKIKIKIAVRKNRQFKGRIFPFYSPTCRRGNSDVEKSRNVPVPISGADVA